MLPVCWLADHLRVIGYGERPFPTSPRAGDGVRREACIDVRYPRLLRSVCPWLIIRRSTRRRVSYLRTWRKGRSLVTGSVFMPGVRFVGGCFRITTGKSTRLLIEKRSASIDKSR